MGGCQQPGLCLSAHSPVIGIFWFVLSSEEELRPTAEGPVNSKPETPEKGQRWVGQDGADSNGEGESRQSSTFCVHLRLSLFSPPPLHCLASSRPAFPAAQNTHPYDNLAVLHSALGSGAQCSIVFPWELTYFGHPFWASLHEEEWGQVLFTFCFPLLGSQILESNLTSKTLRIRVREEI